MRIGIETSALGEKFTGTGRYINCLTEQLQNSGNEIISFSPVGIMSDEPPRKNLVNLAHMGHGGVQRHLYRRFQLANQMTQADIDYAFFPNYFMPPQFNRTSAIVIHDLSFITHPQFYSKQFVFYYNRQLRNTLKKNPVVVTVSEHSQQQIHKYLGIKNEDIFLIQAYSNIIKNKENFQKYKSDRPYLLYVGHVEPRKNLSFLIENFLLWKKTRHVDIKLIIAGEIWIKSASIKNLMKKYFHHSDVEFTGYVEEKKLHELYNGASGFVHTSFVEGFGLPVLEAMHYNLPIICSLGTGTEEISGSNSIKINPYDDSSMQNGLDKIYEKVSSSEKINYNIQYSPENTSAQLSGVLDWMKCKSMFIVPSRQFPPRSTEEAIEKTLLYASMFNSGIKKEHLLNSLFDLKTSGRNLEFALMNLYRDNKIYIKDDAVYSSTGEKNFYEKKKENANLERSEKFLHRLSKLPLISSICFSGGTAHYGLNSHDDVDLFIITKPYSVYIVYFFIHLFSLLFRVRKEICANYLIDEKNMEITSLRDFYTAHQIISLTPYKNKNILNHFLYKNIWIKYFYPNFHIKKTLTDASSKLFLFLSPLNSLIMICYKIFYRELISKRKKSTSLILNTHILKLHSNDHRERITKRFNAEWKRYCDEKNYKHIEPASAQNNQAEYFSIDSLNNSEIRIRLRA